MPWQSRFWFDTEFYENGYSISLISIGVVRQDGATYYAETPDADKLARMTPWLEQNVLPHLRGEKAVRPWDRIASDLIEFMGEQPEIWAYFAAYDWVVLCQLFGTMMNLPKSWPMWCRDVKQLAEAKGNPALPEQLADQHDALADAKHTRDMWMYLEMT